MLYYYPSEFHLYEYNLNCCIMFAEYCQCNVHQIANCISSGCTIVNYVHPKSTPHFPFYQWIDVRLIGTAYKFGWSIWCPFSEVEELCSSLPHATFVILSICFISTRPMWHLPPNHTPSTQKMLPAFSSTFK